MYQNHYVKMSKTSGFTLLELMVAITMSLLILHVLLEVYLGAMRSITVIKSMQQMQYRSGFIASVFDSDIRLAGFSGCMRQEPDIHGASTDIVVSHMTYPAEELSMTMRDSEHMDIGRGIDVHAGDLMMIADCQHKEQFRLKHVSRGNKSQKLESATPLHYRYNEHASVGRYESHQYYVDSVKNALMLREGSGRKVKISDGVRQMHVYYEAKNGVQSARLSFDSKTSENDLAGIGIDMTFTEGKIKQKWFHYIVLKTFRS